MITNAGILARKIKEIIDKYKNKETADSSVGAAPNSGIFRAHISGTIKAEVNYRLSGGSYGFDRNILIGVEIGGGIDKTTSEAIKNEVYKAIYPFDEYNGSDGGVGVEYKSGTNYDTIGLSCGKYSFNKTVAEQLRSILK